MDGMTLQAGNYCTHAIESIYRRSEMERNIAIVLRHSEKFILPHNGELLDVSSLRPEFFDLLRLPYPAVALEFTADMLEGHEKVKVIILAVQNEEDGTIAWHRIAEIGGIWVHIPFKGAIDPERARDQKRSNGEPTFVSKKIDGSLLSGALSDDDLDQLAGQDCLVLLQFCCTINCENITSEIRQPPRLINKMRREKNKEPFYSYRILSLSKNYPGISLERGGTHASPRLHLRRGHLRRLQSGKVVWIRHCMVGNPDRGVVEKVYQMQEKVA